MLVDARLILHLTEVVLVCVLLDVSLLRGLTVMHRCLDLRLHDAHLCDDALNLYHLVYQLSLEPAWSHEVLAEVSFKIYVVGLHLPRKLGVRTQGLLLAALLVV